MTRSFKIDSSSSIRRYTGNTPGEAAKKAADYLFLRNGYKSPLIFFLKETTRGGKKEVYTYTAFQKKLKKPQKITFNNKDTYRTHKILVKKGGANNNDRIRNNSNENNYDNNNNINGNNNNNTPRRSDYEDDEWNNSVFDDMPRLIKATLRLDYNAVKECLDRGDDPNRRYENLDTLSNLIHVDSFRGYNKSKYFSIIKLLVERGADLIKYINIILDYQRYDMFEYVLSLDIDLYENIIPHYDDDNKINLITACYTYGDLKCIEMLDNKYIIDYNYVDNNGDSLLHLIVGTNTNEMIEKKIKFLTDNNIDINIKNNYGYTAYDILMSKYNEHLFSPMTIALIRTSKITLYEELSIKYPKLISSDVEWFAEDLFPEEKTPSEGDWFYNTRDINDKKEIIRIYNKEVLNRLIMTGNKLFNPFTTKAWNKNVLARFTLKPKNNVNTKTTGGRKK